MALVMLLRWIGAGSQSVPRASRTTPQGSEETRATTRPSTAVPCASCHDLCDAAAEAMACGIGEPGVVAHAAAASPEADKPHTAG
jgi:hypothetical protein